MKVISKIPFRKEIGEEANRIYQTVKYSNYSGYFSVFVYANIALYFLFVAHKIFF